MLVEGWFERGGWQAENVKLALQPNSAFAFLCLSVEQH